MYLLQVLLGWCLLQVRQMHGVLPGAQPGHLNLAVYQMT